MSPSRRGDEPNAVTKRDPGAAVFVIPPWVVIVRKDEDVNQSQARQLEFWRRCERGGHRERLECRCGQDRSGGVSDVHESVYTEH